MIPEFPEFKKLEISDKNEVEILTRDHPPYSDFNFTSMWSWNIHDEMKLSNLNGNLVVKFNDYVTGKPFYSFLGIKDVSLTVQKLLNYSISEDLNPELRLIAEEAINETDPDSFVMREDQDNADYILSVDDLCKYEGGRFMNKRNYLNRFKKNHASSTKLIDLSDPEIKEKIISLFRLWHAQKGLEEIYVKHEYNSLARFLDLKDYSSMISVGIFIEDKLVAFWLLEKINEEYCISHYEKANVGEYVGIYSYLVNESAKLLKERNIKFINFEQDLGIPGLRESKRSYSPCAYLKQYTLSYRNA
jgi:uncharacterized protein